MLDCLATNYLWLCMAARLVAVAPVSGHSSTDSLSVCVVTLCVLRCGAEARGRRLACTVGTRGPQPGGSV
jgi:hypothetical protein